jgi:predicted ATPase
LLIVTFRPEFDAPWEGQSHVTSLTLNRLGEREAAAIIARLAGNKALPADVLAEIVERTDGIPLFVEEMTKAVLEAESEGAALRTAAAVPSAALAVPASLHASLMARLDRLGPAKEVAQIGAAIGREFSHALLASVARKSEAELGSALDRLIRAGLLSRQGLPPQASYLFKHALVQDAAYGTLLREPRRALHARIAEAIQSQFAETAESRPEMLAHHCTEAGLIEKAAGLWGKAGHSGRWHARRWSKPRPSSPARWSRSRPCPARRCCVVNRSSFRSRSSPHSSIPKATPPPRPRPLWSRPAC